MNMPKRASCHHFMRRSRSAFTSALSCGTGADCEPVDCAGCEPPADGGGADCAAAGRPDAARPAPAPSIMRQSRLEIRLVSMKCFPVLKDSPRRGGRRAFIAVYEAGQYLLR